ncbi:MAG: hypothetical protein FXF49_05805 [Flexistipes sinusarabici]|uniref:Uncharacterized protein n=1 Tax=Flexistipes sinusarabici TaxID=2352 RepID=A0A5D0MIJ7_FLESI|nr:hypothetical protein [Flexistipes sinusarabici]TYB33544.1 MAG: hypothetical protein FXF49_05805 [Flexistipes sinusarabici]
MDIENKEWFKNTFVKSKEGVVKFTRISRLRIEIASIKKKADERFESLGKKAFQLMKDNEINHDFLLDDYKSLEKLDGKLAELENQIEELKKREEEAFTSSFQGDNEFIKTDSNRDLSDKDTTKEDVSENKTEDNGEEKDKSDTK